jgi:hypothetical protein
LISAFRKNESIQLLPTLDYRKDVAVFVGNVHTTDALALYFLAREFVFVMEGYNTKGRVAIFLHFFRFKYKKDTSSALVQIWK